MERRLLVELVLFGGVLSRQFYKGRQYAPPLRHPEATLLVAPYPYPHEVALLDADRGWIYFVDSLPFFYSSLIVPFPRAFLWPVRIKEDGALSVGGA